MRFRIKIATTLVLIVGLAVSFWPGRGLAASGVIYLSPSNSSVQVGNDVTVAVRIMPGTAVNAVQATVAYSQTDLQFLSASLGAFSTCTQDSGGGGAVTLACAELGSSTSSDALIADITFRALVGSGSTALDVSNANAADNGSYTNPSTSNATVSFTSPPPAPAPTPSAASTGSATSTRHTSSVSTNSSPAATATPPAAAMSTAATVPKLTITAQSYVVQFNTAGITVSTNVAAQVYLAYGTTKTDLNHTTTPGAAAKTTTITLPMAALTPGTTYYYQIIGQVAGGSATKSAIKSFTTEGYVLRVSVLDEHYHPLAGKTVTLHSNPLTATTDSHGVVTFTNVAPGEHYVDYVVSGHTYAEAVYVANNVRTAARRQTAAPQTAAVVLAGYQQPAGHGWLLAGLVVLCVLGAASGLWLGWRVRRGQLALRQTVAGWRALFIKRKT